MEKKRDGAQANRSCRLYLTLQRPADEGARVRFFYCRVGREEYVWLKFQSRSSAFSAMKGGIERKRTGQPVTITTKVCTTVEGRRMRGMTRRETECLASFHLRVIEISL